MIGQAVRTPFGILILTFYSIIGLGQNQHRWKANKKLCKLAVPNANRSIQMAPIWMEIYGVRTALRKF
jgi:hypothetical protein